MNVAARTASSTISRRPPAGTTTRQIYGGPAGDPGLIGPDSMSWEINADLAAVSQAGLPAIVLEILHPSVVAGVQDLSNYRRGSVSARPRHPRLRADHDVRQYRGGDRRSSNTSSTCTPSSTGPVPTACAYRALDPELIAWVHTCIPWMIMRAYEHTNRPLTRRGTGPLPGRAGGDRPDGRRRLGPDDRRRTRRLRRERCGHELSVNAQTREFIDFLMTSPFFPQLCPASVDRQLHRFAIYAGMSRAPRWARELIGFDHPPCADPHADRAGTAVGRAQVALGVRHPALRPTGAARTAPRCRRPPRCDRRPADRGRRRRHRRRPRGRVGRPHQPAHTGRRASGGSGRWAATDYGRGGGPPSRRVPDDGLPPLPAPR